MAREALGQAENHVVLVPSLPFPSCVTLDKALSSLGLGLPAMGVIGPALDKKHIQKKKKKK